MSLSALHVFCKVLELSSFRQAADCLCMPVATVSNQIKTLEIRLGTRLFIRSSRRVEATAEGLAYYNRIVPLLEGLSEADSMLSDTRLHPKGRLNVSLPASVARWIVAPRLPEFQALYPDINLRIMATDQILDLGSAGLDCAVRAATPTNDGLVTKNIVKIPQYFAASPALIAQHQFPATIEALACMPFINFAAERNSSDIQVLAFQGTSQRQFTAHSPISIDDGAAYLSLACAGMGVIQSPAYDLNPELQASRLRILMPLWRGPDLPFHIVFAQGRVNIHRVTAFVSWMTILLCDPLLASPTVQNFNYP